jgi:hypothetical protein
MEMLQDMWHCEICNCKPGRGFGMLLLQPPLFLLFAVDLLEWHLVISKICCLSYLCYRVIQCFYYILLKNQNVAHLYVMLCNYACAIY